MARSLTRRATLGIMAAAATVTPACADDAVDLQLVLAVDTSGSVNRQRFELQRVGYADAFRNPMVQNVILSGPAGGVAVCMTHWTGPIMQEVTQPWVRLGSIAGCNAFADAIANGPRRLYSGGTSISGAIDHGRSLFERCPFTGPARSPASGQSKALAGVRRVIDVSGDGENNRGRAPGVARDAAVAQDITINGLPILAIEPNLDDYYRDHVIGGAGSFLIAAETFETFGEAVRRKLIQEIS